MKPIARLGLGWLLMLGGAVLLLESSLALRPHGRTLAAVEALAGFALAVAGWWLRRTATRNGDAR